MKRAVRPVDEQQIRAKAYELWEARGRPQGTSINDWLEAELLLTGRKRRYGLKELNERLQHPQP